MEMDPLHPADHTEAAEPGPSRKPPSYKDAQVWKDLEAETGFASCADYLEFYKDVRRDFIRLLNRFQSLPEDLVTAENNLDARERSSMIIYDLSKQENLPISLSLRRYCHSGTELIQALRKPPGDVCVQLVLWFCSDRPLNQEMADALVLGLKLDPQILWKAARLGDIEDLGGIGLPRMGFRASQIKSVVGKGTVAAISQKFMPEVANSVPVLLVASDETLGHRSQAKFERMLAKGEHIEPPIHRSAFGEHMPLCGMGSDGVKRRTHGYARSVEQFILLGGSASSSKAFQLLAATSPLLYVEAYRVRQESNNVRHTYESLTFKRLRGVDNLDTVEKNLGNRRLKLRRTLEEAEDHVSQIFRYLDAEVKADWSQELSYVGIRADWVSLIGEARRLETELRDYMQLVVGNLSLEESRRSIELSNLQIREAKSVKICEYKTKFSTIVFIKSVIVTILAFIYVPLNLATSIFGMNIQQLNKSGQNLWVFFVTAVVALLVTGGSWLCSTWTAKAVVWYKQRPASHSTSNKRIFRREYGLLLRMAMLVWLVRNGHKAWMWKSGAWLAILIGSEVSGKGEDTGAGQPACDYVSKYSQRSEDLRGIYFPVYTSPYHITWSPLSGFLSKFSKSKFRA